MAIYLNISTIKGPAEQEGFKDQIEVISCSFAANRDIPQQTKSVKNRSMSEAQYAYVNISKEWDGISSAKLLDSLNRGTMNMSAEISFTTQTDSGSLTYLTVKLENVGLVQYGFGASGGGMPSETITLAFTNIEVTPWTLGSDKKPVKGGVIKHDLPTGVSS
jgi:type VI protein secretion system component Hcp